MIPFFLKNVKSYFNIRAKCLKMTLHPHLLLISL